jgi:hypothetical protein
VNKKWARVAGPLAIVFSEPSSSSCMLLNLARQYVSHLVGRLVKDLQPSSNSDTDQTKLRVDLVARENFARLGDKQARLALKATAYARLSRARACKKKQA